MKSVQAIVAMTMMLAAGAQAQGAGWGYHKEVKINTSASGANIPGKVDKYPLAMMLTAANFDFAQAKDDGSDLRVTKADGSPLPFEIEMWDKAGQKAAVWVKVDVVGNSASQAITLHWGNPSAAASGDGKAVFATADGYIGVWHLNETGNTDADGYKDATGNAAHGTGVNTKATNTVDGRVGKAHKNVRADKTWIKVDGPKKDLFNPTTGMWTVSVWSNITTWPAGEYQNVMSKGDVSWTLQRDGPGKDFEHCTAATPYHICSVSGSDVPVNTWHLLSCVWVKNSYLEFGYDGKFTDKTPFTGSGTNWSNWRTGTDPVGIGNQGRTAGTEVTRWWDGILDEARVVSFVESPDWIKLDFESQKEGSKLLEFGPSQPTFVRRTIPGWLPEKATVPTAYDVRGRILGLKLGRNGAATPVLLVP